VQSVRRVPAWRTQAEFRVMWTRCCVRWYYAVLGRDAGKHSTATCCRSEGAASTTHFARLDRTSYESRASRPGRKYLGCGFIAVAMSAHATCLHEGIPLPGRLLTAPPNERGLVSHPPYAPTARLRYMPHTTPTEHPKSTLLSTGTHKKLIRLIAGQNLYPSFIIGHSLFPQSA
jgi:hypothetical protein